MAQVNQIAKGTTGTEANYTIQVEVDRVLPVGANVIVYRNGTSIGEAVQTTVGGRRYELTDMDVSNGPATYTARVVDGSYTAPESPAYAITVEAASTAKIDLSTFTTDLRSVFFKKEEPFLPYDVDFDQEIVNRIVNANGHSDKYVFKENLTITYEHILLQSEYYVQVTLTVVEDQYFTGTNSFIYQRLSPSWAYSDGSDQYAYATVVTDEIDATIAVDSWYQSQDIYPPDFGELGYVPVTFFTGSNAVNVVRTRNLYWYKGPGTFDPIHARFRFLEVTPYPYEAEFDFTVSTTGVVQVFVDTINSGPTSMEVLSAPSGFNDPIILFNGVNTAVSLIPGTYQVRITYPNARLLSAGFFNDAYIKYSPNLKVTTLRKLRSPSCYQAFSNMTTLTTILPGALTEGASSVSSMYRAFYNCSALTALPVGLLDGMVRCENFSGTFSHSGLTSLPTQLFNNIPKTIWQNGQRTLSQCFWACPLTSLPSGLFHNLMGVTWTDTFLECTGLTSLPADLFTGYMELLSPNSSLWEEYVPLRNYTPGPYYDFDGTFQGCRLTSIPAELFSQFRNKELQMYLTSTFQSNTTLTSIPAGLFDNLLVYHRLSYQSQSYYQFTSTFSGCTNLTTIPVGLFDNLTEVPGDKYSGLYSLGSAFQNCPLITSVPNGMFKNKTNLEYVYSTFAGTGVTATESDLFAGSPNIIEVRSLFSGAKLAAIPPGMFAGMTKLKVLDKVFAGSTNTYTSIPADLLTGCTVEDITGLFAVSDITSIPSGLFAGLPLKRIDDVFATCLSLTTIPENLFNQPDISSAQRTFQSSAVTTLPNKLFGIVTGTISLTQMFAYTSVAVIPDEFLYGLDNITDIYEMFRNCPLDHIGPMIYNKTSIRIDVRNAFNNCGSFTIDPDMILSDVVCTLDRQTGGGSASSAIFYQSLPTAQVDTLFGANVRILGTQFFQGLTSLTGSGNSFITKHLVPDTQVDLFAGCTGLSDYGSLPAWAL